MCTSISNKIIILELDAFWKDHEVVPKLIRLSEEFPSFNRVYETSIEVTLTDAKDIQMHVNKIKEGQRTQ